jgi:hypothetical protein
VVDLLDTGLRRHDVFESFARGSISLALNMVPPQVDADVLETIQQALIDER